MTREIHLVTQYYQVRNGDSEYQKKRQYEINECLKKNCSLSCIYKIHLLLEEEIFVKSTEENLRHPKVICVILGKRMTYDDVFSYYNTHLLGKICILANADIFFNESIDFLQYINFSDTVIALTRYESPLKDEGDCILYGQDCNLVKNNPWLEEDEIAVFSQDSWMWCQNEAMYIPHCDFYLGITGCDNMIVRRFLQASMNVINPCNYIASIHYDFMSILPKIMEDGERINDQYIEKGQISSMRSTPVGNFTDYVFLHPSLTLPELDPISKSRCLVKTTYIEQSNCTDHHSEHNFRKQIYSTIYFSTLKPIYVNSSQIDFNVISDIPLRLALDENEMLRGIGNIYVPLGCTTFEVSIHYAKYIVQRDIEFISKASHVSIYTSARELRPSCEAEWKEMMTIEIPSCYRKCRKLIYRLFNLTVPCRSVRLRFKGEELSDSELSLLLKHDSSQSISSWISEKSIDLLLNLSLHIDYMPVIETFDHITCTETLNKYFQNTAPKSIEKLFSVHKQNKIFYKTIKNMESFYSSYIGVKKTLIEKNITGHERNEGNTLLITIMNRTKNLTSYFETWINQESLDEIVIVDWSTSDKENTMENYLCSYTNYPSSLKSIILVRIEGEIDYYRTVAQNIGASFATYNKILKLDSDISLKENFFGVHPLCQNEFYVGDWKLARDDNEKYTHGNIYLFTKDFFNINGYDERIRSYGWEDSDFTQRLELSGLEKKYINIDYTYHNPHSNLSRVCNLRKNEISTIKYEAPEILTQTNRFLLLKMSRWCHVYPRHSFTLLECETYPGRDIPLKKYVLSRNKILGDYQFPTEEYREALKEATLIVSLWNSTIETML